MSFRVLKLACVVFLLVTLTPAVVCAQFSSSMMRTFGSGVANDAVTSVGTASVKIKPERLRMYVQLVGKGKTLKDALDSLENHREAALLQLEALKVDKDSISLGTPTVAAQSQQQQLEMMVRARMGMGASKAVKKGPRVYQVNVSLTAEWPLPSDKPDELLLFVDNLTEKIKKVDLSGEKDTRELSPEEQELLEEMEGAVTSYSGRSDQVQVGKPYFVYVGTISGDQRNKAMREAFVKAKKNAEELALAAKVRLGPLTGLSGGGSGSSNRYGNYGPYGNSYQIRNYLQQMMRGQAGEDETSENEVIGYTPGVLSYQIAVVATFKLAE